MKCIKVNKPGRIGATSIEIIRTTNEKAAEMVAEKRGTYTSKSKWRVFCKKAED
jgi:hypothetical protein